jgi:hypothetical protein
MGVVIATLGAACGCSQPNTCQIGDNLTVGGGAFSMGGSSHQGSEDFALGAGTELGKKIFSHYIEAADAAESTNTRLALANQEGSVDQAVIDSIAPAEPPNTEFLTPIDAESSQSDAPAIYTEPSEFDGSSHGDAGTPSADASGAGGDFEPATPVESAHVEAVPMEPPNTEFLTPIDAESSGLNSAPASIEPAETDAGFNGAFLQPVRIEDRGAAPANQTLPIRRTIESED